MSKAPINRVKGKMWTPTMTIEFDGNIAGGVTSCFRGLPTDKMEKVIEELKEIQAARLSNPSGLVGTTLTTAIVDEVQG